MKEYHRGFFVVTGLSIGFPTHTKKLKRIFFFCHYLIYNINKHSTGVIINVIFLPEQVYYIYH